MYVRGNKIDMGYVNGFNITTINEPYFRMDRNDCGLSLQRMLIGHAMNGENVGRRKSPALTPIHSVYLHTPNHAVA